MRAPAILILCLSLGYPSAARAAGFDCARAATPVERAICADPALSALDGEMSRRYAAALAISPLPQTLRAGQHAFLKARDALTGTAEEWRRAYENRLADLQQEIDLGRAAAMPHAASERATTCLLRNFEDKDASCTVSESGPIPGARGPALFFQLHTHANTANDMDYPASGWVIAAAQPDGALRPMLWNADIDAHFARPEIIKSPIGLLLEVPGSNTGTAVMNAGSLFHFHDGAWREVDTVSWQRDLAARLPKGREIWKGMYPDWVRLRVQSPIWIVGRMAIAAPPAEVSRLGWACGGTGSFC